MALTVSTKQNYIYLALVILFSIASIILYRATHKEWMLFREAEEKYEAKEYDSAIDLYIRALDDGFPHNKVDVHLANSYVAIGKFNEAIPLYQEYLLNYPKDVSARLALARALTWTGDVKSAEIEYQKIFEYTHENLKKK